MCTWLSQSCRFKDLARGPNIYRIWSHSSRYDICDKTEGRYRLHVWMKWHISLRWAEDMISPNVLTLYWLYETWCISALYRSRIRGCIVVAVSLAYIWGPKRFSLYDIDVSVVHVVIGEKRPSFCTPHVQIHFLVRKVLCCGSIFLSLLPGVQLINSMRSSDIFVSANRSTIGSDKDIRDTLQWQFNSNSRFPF